jgi:hypothetical protein
MKHTAEPWHVNRIGKNMYVESPLGFIADLQLGECTFLDEAAVAAANAARIVACVNACAGMDDPVAEIKRLREIEEAWQGITSNDPYPGVEGADE